MAYLPNNQNEKKKNMAYVTATATSNATRNNSGNVQKTVDLSRLYNAIGSRPEQVFNLREMRPLLESQRTAGTITTPRTFGLERVSNAIEQARQSGREIAVRQPRYQTTEQLGQLVGEINRMLDPLTKAQQQAAQSGFNQNMQKLRDQWASRGLLASGVAASQERQAADNLISQLANIEAEQQARAIPLAFNYADLGLREDAQRFSQEESNRNFLAQQAQNYVNNLLSGMSQEEAQRQFQQQFEQDRAQRAVENMLRTLGFQEDQLQNYIRNIMNATQMEIGQNQWSQEFGRQQSLDDFNRLIQTAQLTGEINGRPTLEAQQLSGRMPLPSNVQLLVNTILNEKRANASKGIDEKEKELIRQQADVARQQLAMLGYDPNLLGKNVGINDAIRNISQMALTLPAQNQYFNQGLAQGELTGIYNGRPTLSAQQLALNALQNFAQMTPFIPRGMGNVTQNMPAFSGLSNLLNQIGGQPSQSTYNQRLQDALSRWTTQQELAFNREKLNADVKLERARLAQDADYKSWLKQQGISEQKARSATNGYIAKALRYPDAESAMNYVRTYAESIVDDGANITDIFRAIQEYYGTTGSGTLDFSSFLSGKGNNRPQQP